MSLLVQIKPVETVDKVAPWKRGKVGWMGKALFEAGCDKGDLPVDHVYCVLCISQGALLLCR